LFLDGRERESKISGEIQPYFVHLQRWCREKKKHGVPSP